MFARNPAGAWPRRGFLLWGIKRSNQNDQPGQQGERTQQGHEHGKTGEQAKINGGNEVRQHQYGETGNDGQRGVEHGLADTAVTAMHGGQVVAVFGELGFEAMDVNLHRM